MLSLSKGFVLSFVSSNVVVAIVVFAINTWVNLNFSVQVIGDYAFQLAVLSLLFTAVDWGRLNSALMEEEVSRSSLLNDILLSFVLCAVALLFDFITVGTGLTASLVIAQRYTLNYCLKSHQIGLIWLLQIAGALLRLILLATIFYALPEESIKIGMIALVIVAVFFIRPKNTWSRAAINIGVLNIGLLAVERFDVLVLHEFLSIEDYATLSALLSYTYIIGITADPMIKLLYKEHDVLTISVIDKFFKDWSRIILFGVIAAICVTYAVTDYLFGDKFQNVLAFSAYAIPFQIARVTSQIYEITIVKAKTTSIIGLRLLSLLVLGIGIVVLVNIGLGWGLVVFVCARMIPIYAVRFV